VLMCGRGYRARAVAARYFWICAFQNPQIARAAASGQRVCFEG